MGRPATEVVCEKVTIDAGTENENWYLVQYETPDDEPAKTSCLGYLKDCGHIVTCEPHPTVGIGDDPAVSWGDLSDIVAPRDE